MTTDLTGALWEILPYMLGGLLLLAVDTFDRWRHPDA